VVPASAAPERTLPFSQLAEGVGSGQLGIGQVLQPRLQGARAKTAAQWLPRSRRPCRLHDQIPASCIDRSISGRDESDHSQKNVSVLWIGKPWPNQGLQRAGRIAMHNPESPSWMKPLRSRNAYSKMRVHLVSALVILPFDSALLSAQSVSASFAAGYLPFPNPSLRPMDPGFPARLPERCPVAVKAAEWPNAPMKALAACGRRGGHGEVAA